MSRRGFWKQGHSVSLSSTPQTRGYWHQVRQARQQAMHPLARWRRAVAATFEFLIVLIVPLLLWGMIAEAALPMMLGIGLSLGLVLLTGATLLMSFLAAELGEWQPGDGR